MGRGEVGLGDKEGALSRKHRPPTSPPHLPLQTPWSVGRGPGSPPCSDAQRRHPSLRRQTPGFSTPKTPSPHSSASGSLFAQQHPQELGSPSQGGPHTPFLEQMGAGYLLPHLTPSPASARVGGGGAVTGDTAQRRVAGGRPPQVSPTQNPGFPRNGSAAAVSLSFE